MWAGLLRTEADLEAGKMLMGMMVPLGAAWTQRLGDVESKD